LPSAASQRPPGAWRKLAACAGVADPDAFFPEPEDWATPRPWGALALCGVCPVRARCLAYAVDAGEQGIWGGTTDTDRDLLKLAGWDPGDPLPEPVPVWLAVQEVAVLLDLSAEVIHLWARRRQVDSRPDRAPTGQARRLVRVDQVRARAARADPARLHRKATA